MTRHACVQVGELLLDEYCVEEILPRGSECTIALARRSQKRGQFAIKIADRRDGGGRALERLERQFQASRLIASAHVMEVFDHRMLSDGRGLLVMERLKGRSLDQLQRREGSLQRERTVDLIIQTCQGLASAHGVGIVHRDLKPSHVFVRRDGSGQETVKLLDFGAAQLPGLLSGRRPSDPDRLTLSSEIGTPPFVAPEQMLDPEHVDTRSDIWALGVMLYLLLTGHAPFADDSPARVCSRVLNEPTPSLHGGGDDLPPNLIRVVMRCLQKDPSERFQDLSELAVSLASFGSDGAMDAAQSVASSLVRAGIRPRETFSTQPAMAEGQLDDPDSDSNYFRRATRKLNADAPDPHVVAALLAAKEQIQSEPESVVAQLDTGVGTRRSHLRMVVSLTVLLLSVLAGYAIERVLTL